MPVINVNNNCASGASALFIANKFLLGNVYDCVLVFGFEKMQTGSLQTYFNDRMNPLSSFIEHLDKYGKLNDVNKFPFAAQLFGSAGNEHIEN